MPAPTGAQALKGKRRKWLNFYGFAFSGDSHARV